MVQEDGSYSGFDEQEFTSRSGGKCKAIMHIKVTPMASMSDYNLGIGIDMCSKSMEQLPILRERSKSHHESLVC